MSIDTNTVIDWDDAPEGATHYSPETDSSRACWYKDNFTRYWLDLNWRLGAGRWISCDRMVEGEHPIPRPKPLTQAVFDGLPSEYRWAAISSDGRAHAHKCAPKGATAAYWSCVRGCAAYLIGEGYGTTNWQNSLIERKDVSSRVEQLRSIEAARQIEKDAVNNPSHYTTGGIECIDAMQTMLSRDEFIGYLRGNIFKYQWRYKHKNGIEDLKKAQWYANRLIELEGGK